MKCTVLKTKIGFWKAELLLSLDRSFHFSSQVALTFIFSPWLNPLPFYPLYVFSEKCPLFWFGIKCPKLTNCILANLAHSHHLPLDIFSCISELLKREFHLFKLQLIRTSIWPWWSNLSSINNVKQVNIYEEVSFRH